MSPDVPAFSSPLPRRRSRPDLHPSTGSPTQRAVPGSPLPQAPCRLAHIPARSSNNQGLCSSPGSASTTPFASGRRSRVSLPRPPPLASSAFTPRGLLGGTAEPNRLREAPKAPTHRRGRRRGGPRSLTVALGSVGHAEEQGGVAAELRGKGGQRRRGGTRVRGVSQRAVDAGGGSWVRGGGDRTRGDGGTGRGSRARTRGRLRGAGHRAAAAKPGSP